MEIVGLTSAISPRARLASGSIRPHFKLAFSRPLQVVMYSILCISVRCYPVFLEFAASPKSLIPISSSSLLLATLLLSKIPQHDQVEPHPRALKKRCVLPPGSESSTRVQMSTQVHEKRMTKGHEPAGSASPPTLYLAPVRQRLRRHIQTRDRERLDLLAIPGPIPSIPVR